MMLTLEEKIKLITEDILGYKFKNPIEIIKSIMNKPYINIHGPEHHFLDGASFLAAYKNSGADIDLNKSLEELSKRSIKMPGAMCGYWGVCGASTSLGAALSVIHNTTPLSNDDFYKHHMEYTSRVINKMSKIGGPRCCKRNAFIAIFKAVSFVKEKYNIEMEMDNITCEFTTKNSQCIKNRCPFYKENI